jgi:nucleoside-diphosphate-sugar epimerase
VDGTRRHSAPFYLNEGTNVRGWVHIDDLIQIYVRLVEAAAAGGGSVSWGLNVSTLLKISFESSWTILNTLIGDKSTEFY